MEKWRAEYLIERLGEAQTISTHAVWDREHYKWAQKIEEILSDILDDIWKKETNDTTTD